jgi:cobalt/nickel transport system permease protein
VPNKIVQLFFFCGRYLHLFMNETQRLRTAMKIRGFQPRTDFHTYKSYAYLVGMLLVRSVDRSERIYRAMLCRGFTGEFPTFVDFRFRRSDGVFTLCFTCFLLCLIVMEWNPWPL